jgi:hypothetical protein
MVHNAPVTSSSGTGIVLQLTFISDRLHLLMTKAMKNKMTGEKGVVISPKIKIIKY